MSKFLTGFCISSYSLTVVKVNVDLLFVKGSYGKY